MKHSTDDGASHESFAAFVARLGEIVRVFLRLGCIAFGGPVAHLGYFREELVAKRQWLDDSAYTALVALCQFLPGPASSQLVYALGARRAGWVGGLVASLCFTLPSAVLMILCGYGVAALGDWHDLQRAGWIHGLKLAAVAVVAQAVWGMRRSLCPDGARLGIALVAAAVLLLAPSAWVQVGVIFGGGVIGWWLYRRELGRSPSGGGPVQPLGWRSHWVAGGVLLLFLLLLGGLPLAVSLGGGENLAVFDRFYRAGALVFGGGHVVLPLLHEGVVPPGWISESAFLAGYGMAQAVPGPLFTFAAYLGTVIYAHSGHAWLGGVWCLLAIFLPAWLLIAGALPFWTRWQGMAWAQSALRGANAAVLGILAAALVDPVWRTSVSDWRDVAVVLVALALLQRWRVPPWAVVVGAAAVGQFLIVP